MRVIDQETGESVKKRIKGESVLYEGKHEAIISKEQFEKANAIYGSNAPTKKSVELMNPLAGLLFCPKCGRALVRQNYGVTDNIIRRPRLSHPFNTGCSVKSAMESVVIEALLEAMKQSIEDYTIKLKNSNDGSEMQRHIAALDAMEKELEKQEKMKRRLFDSWEADDGMYTRDEFVERKQMYTANIEKLKGQIAYMQANAPKSVNYEEQIASIHKMIDCIKDESIPAKSKNIFLKQFIDRIEYDCVDLGKKKGGKPILNIVFK